ncbi:MAG: YggT family protein [SAR202 cluster bacterium]|nr:YggT family protein [SAR202 cluster bacterium]
MDEYLVRFINALVTALYIAMIGRVLTSWIQVGRDSPFFPVVSILWQVTEPILAPIRKVLPNLGMLDLSPMVALLLLGVVQRVFISALS